MNIFEKNEFFESDKIRPWLKIVCELTETPYFDFF